ncbi:hypothetical protein [Allorhodopirellula solitaria]|nr:hypothetical protein [Allorhodopirellula solitaria]
MRPRKQASGAKCTNCHSLLPPAPPPIAPTEQSGETLREETPPPDASLIRTQPRETTFAPRVRSRLGLFSFIGRYFKATRWPVWFWTPVGLLIAALISILKPAVAGVNLYQIAFASFAFGCVAFAVFALARSYDFVFRKVRTIPRRPRSKIAKLAYGGVIVSFYLAGLAVIESYAGPRGFLASRFPKLGAFQSQMLGESQSLPADPVSSPSIPSNEVTVKSPTRTTPENAALRSKPRIQEQATERANAVDANRTTTASPVTTVTSTPAPPSKAPLNPKPVRSWMNSTGNSDEMVAADTPREIPEPGGGYSAKFSPNDRGAVISSGSSIDDEPDANGGRSAGPQLTHASEIEAAIGLDGESIASKLTSHEGQPISFEPGGTFSEPLIVPLGTKIHGGAKAVVQPGGAF